MTKLEELKMTNLLGALAQAGSSGEPFLVFDPRFDEEETLLRLRALAAVLDPDPVLAIAIRHENLKRLSIMVPPDVDAAYRSGQPAVLMGVKNENRAPRAAQRPEDSLKLSEAKRGQAVEAFRLVDVYKAAELGGNSRANAVTPAEAEDRAKLALGAAAGVAGARDRNRARRKIRGLIDRGRRFAATFFGTDQPKDRPKADAAVAAAEIADVNEKDRAAAIARLQTNARDRMRDLSFHVVRATFYDRAMAAWSTTAREGDAIDLVRTG